MAGRAADRQPPEQVVPQDSQRLDREADRPPPRPFAELRPTGLLWLINRTVFHPRGYALALHFDTDDGTGPCTGWSLLGDGTEPWAYADDEDACFQAVEALFAALHDQAHGEEEAY